MKYNNFEDLPVWQQSRKLVNRVYKLIDLNQKFCKDFSLVDQLKRAVLSISLNIAEGFERGGNREFANFINIAKGSAGEVRAILYVLLDREYVTKDLFEQIRNEVLEISINLSNFRKYLVKHQNYKKLTNL